MSANRKSKEVIVMMVNRTAWVGKSWDDESPPAELRDAVIAFLHQKPSPDGQVVVMTPMRVPFGLSSETLEKVHLNPVNVESWCYLDNMSETDQKQIRLFLASQREQEQQTRAVSAGIVLPGQGRAPSLDLEKLRRGGK
jgi:hypothetical protein